MYNETIKYLTKGFFIWVICFQSDGGTKMAEKKSEAVEGKTFVQNLFSGSAWLRVLFMALFVLIYGVAEVLLTAVVLLQIVFVLVTGDRNDRLTAFGKSLSLFVYEIILYWTYNSEDKPFPFTSWPGEDQEA